ncbi:MAG: tRNA (adenosine(37)-N6)-threonylcarbamoyltransferase complex ATPase subunit type 1 TsaE [Proteobacteria bacterium]|nr:tRNA (adenosine(37)-N6)-threonylcarbamoyltransferase complex ATPase subunit type 1 TsaE [Pseudomonadota bacterium]
MHEDRDQVSSFPPQGIFQGDDTATSLFLPDEAATLALGGALAAALTQVPPGIVVYLEGDLGAGKTTLVRGLLRELGYAGKVKSPTYTLVELYAISRLNLYHFDFYRFEQPEEYLDAGLDEYFQDVGICLVEWPDKAGAYLPPADLRVRLSLAQDGRQAELLAQSGKGRVCLTSLNFRPDNTPDATSSSSLPQR